MESRDYCEYVSTFIEMTHNGLDWTSWNMVKSLQSLPCFSVPDSDLSLRVATNNGETIMGECNREIYCYTVRRYGKLLMLSTCWNWIQVKARSSIANRHVFCIWRCARLVAYWYRYAPFCFKSAATNIPQPATKDIRNLNTSRKKRRIHYSVIQVRHHQSESFGRLEPVQASNKDRVVHWMCCT